METTCDESQVYTEAESNNNAGSYQDGGCRERNPLGLAKMTVVQGRECGEESWKKNSKINQLKESVQWIVCVEGLCSFLEVLCAQ